jgi:hypothetical protein
MKSANKQETEPSWEFYDLQKDPQELTNLFENYKYQSEILKMHKALINQKAYYEDHQTEVPSL